MKKSNKKDREKTKQSIYNNITTLCSRCCQVKPKSEFGEYKTCALKKYSNRFQEIMLSYKSCERCREQRKQYQADKYDSNKNTNITNHTENNY